VKDIVPKDSRYIPFTQQKSCCVLACISMIMYKNRIPLLPQELLGYHLGLIVSPEDKRLFWNVTTGKKPLSGYGTRISVEKYNPNLVKSKKYDPNLVFKKLKIPLKMMIHPIADFNINSFVGFIIKSIKNDGDILVCLNNGILNGNESSGGHLCVIDRIYPSKKEVRIIDPSYNKPKWRIIKINKLKKSMEVHPAKGGAFWEFIKIKW